MELVNTLCEKLFALTYESTYGKFKTIDTSHRDEIKEVVRDVLIEYGNKTAQKITELETKIKVYEEIISKSNFAPFVEDKKEAE